jgi:hypothetical protein
MLNGCVSAGVPGSVLGVRLAARLPSLRQDLFNVS